MNWHIGQEIVCIKTHTTGVIKRVQIFTIKGLRESYCKCNMVEIDIGIEESGNHRCSFCGWRSIEVWQQWWFSEHRFAPLEYDQQAIDELLEQPCEV